MRERSTPDANGWVEGLDDADEDEIILVLVPAVTEDGEPDYIHSLAWWVEGGVGSAGRWDGEWRYIDMPGAGDLEPSHWKPRALDLPVAYETEAEVEMAGMHAAVPGH